MGTPKSGVPPASLRLGGQDCPLYPYNSLS